MKSIIEQAHELCSAIEEIPAHEKQTAASLLASNLSQRISRRSPEGAAKAAYETYCQSVGGKAFNGDPLPGWVEFSADPNKQNQAQAWKDAAAAILAL